MAYQISLDLNYNGRLYRALSNGEDDYVIGRCRELLDGPLHILTIHDDSVLHVASHFKRSKLVIKLLELLPEGEANKLRLQNDAGSTILHAMATNNNTVKAAAQLLSQAPSLLTMTDRLGETALFRAARYGKTNIFNFLQGEMNKNYPEETIPRNYLVRDDKVTILHAAINSENFSLAYSIAETYPFLMREEDEDGMTALQLLACKPSAFATGVKDSFFKSLFKKFIYRVIDSRPEKKHRLLIIRERQRQKHKSKWVKEIADLLVNNDVSWEETQPMFNRKSDKPHKYGGGDTTAEQDISSEKDTEINVTAPRTPDSPLFLATKSGCTDIVKGILNSYPQAIEYIDEDGCNILHVAVKYRRMDVYDYVTSMENPLRGLRSKNDKDGNTILHMVALKETDQKAERGIRSPAQELRDDLILFERVKNMGTALATLQVNNNGVTAEQLFNQKNGNLRTEAKEWMKSTAENSSIIAVLIATVAFAAAYTVPGGPDQDTGYPLLKNKPLFIVFALADALSLSSSLTSVIIFLSILTSSFKFENFRTSLHSKLLLGFTVLIFSVATMMVAFAATLFLTIKSQQHWTKIVLYVIAFFPVTVFVFSYVDIYIDLIKAYTETVRKLFACKPTKTNDDESLPSNAPCKPTKTNDDESLPGNAAPDTAIHI